MTGHGGVFVRRKAARLPKRRTTASRKMSSRSGKKSVSTARVSRRKTNSAIGGGSGFISYSSFNMTRKASSVAATIKRSGAQNNLLEVNSYRMTCPIGQQIVQDYPIFSGGTFTQSNSFSDIAAIVSLVGGSTVGTTKPTTTTRVLLESAYVKNMITNATDTNCHLTVYDIMARRDSSIEPVFGWNTGLLDSSAGSNNSYALGGTPFTSSLFTSEFRVVKQQKVALPPGTTHAHVVNYRPNKVFNAEILRESVGTLGGLTMYTMFVAHGSPIDDSVNNSLVSTSACVLNVVQTKQLRYTWVADTQNNFTSFNYLNTITTANVMNEESGAVETAKFA